MKSVCTSGLRRQRTWTVYLHEHGEAEFRGAMLVGVYHWRKGIQDTTRSRVKEYLNGNH